MQKTPRVLFLYDFPLHGGGSGAYIKYLALRLKEAYQYDLAIAAPDTEEIGHGIPLYKIDVPQVPVFVGRPGLETSKKYSQLTPLEITELYNAYLRGTIKAVEAFKPDIIHTHHMMLNTWAARYIRAVYGTRFIVTSHGSCLHAIASDRRYFRMTRDALRAASAITVVSGDSRSKLMKAFGSDLSSKTRTIPGGVRMSLFTDVPDVSDLRKKYAPNGEKIALFAGRLVTEKGVEYLVKAAKSIQGTVLIVGDGPQRPRLAQIVLDKKLTNVQMVPFISNYAELIRMHYLADVFVAPAVWDEPFPLSLIEAMATGTPVIVTRKGGIPMAVRDGYNGFFVRPHNASEIALAVNKLFADPVLAHKMGKRGHDVVEKRFTWTQIAHRFDTLYRWVAL